jgi:hypothetical protein
MCLAKDGELELKTSFPSWEWPIPSILKFNEFDELWTPIIMMKMIIIMSVWIGRNVQRESNK